MIKPKDIRESRLVGPMHTYYRAWTTVNGEVAATNESLEEFHAETDAYARETARRYLAEELYGHLREHADKARMELLREIDELRWKMHPSEACNVVNLSMLKHKISEAFQPILTAGDDLVKGKEEPA